MKHKKVLILTVVSLFIALTVVLSNFNIPIGTAKIFPIQHATNVLLGVLFGPLYALTAAFVSSTIRVILGTGSLLAYPGSMIGAFLAGYLYKKYPKLLFAYIGEVLGTGVLGAILAYPIATFILGKEAALFGYVVPFSLSSLVGALTSIVIISTLEKSGALKYLKQKMEVYS